MVYVCSDIHGFWDKYMNFIDVHLGEQDTLYIIGDVLDRGREGIKILQDVMSRKNVVLIKGNHEHMILPTFNELCYSDEWSQLAIIRDEICMTQIGQEDTLRDFCKLSRREQLRMIHFLNSLPLYQTVVVNSQKYLLVHAGLPDFNPSMGMTYYTADELLFGPHDFSVKHFKNTIILVGHLPTRFIPGAEPDSVFESGDSIAIDCGLGFGGRFGVICLDTGEKFYG